ncbi:NADPH:quinone reductase-like Zn-dependent oxidoreductase [Rhizobium sp. PP-F2F-G48]|uniref:zinc-dependent alcohol dehydrogenase family protein n=1 Tax=Rhizobium sp. PP-F2F-G48 TaxID=2135651 RepID=UPI0010504EAE|nr:NAD(P)-dependent alcohol dehydrogenase [Rhizobium sp. PP-F2F-G48]TCM52577.1 NADPH:quinone reductase-like Zn-dependent oxidoreductase [Rhizobium sp. PP-F2F-G48]
MKAIQAHPQQGLDGLTLIDLPDPGTPGPNAIRVRVHATSLNFHGLGVVTGRLTAVDGRIPMADGAGVVEAVGSEVTEFEPGDHVVSTFFPTWLDGEASLADFTATPGDGIDRFAREFVVAPATSFTRAPAGWSQAAAATLTTAGVTAWRGLVVNGGLKVGDSVLVLGTGGVSIFALQIARAMGATVIANSSSYEKLERLRTIGAAHVINYRQDENWGDRVRDLTGGTGVDHVVEVGGPGTLAQSIKAARVGGHISLIGVLTGSACAVPTAMLMARQQRLQGLIVGSRQHQLDLIRGLDAVHSPPVIDRSFPLADIADAFRFQESGGHFGKIVVEY